MSVIMRLHVHLRCHTFCFSLGKSENPGALLTLVAEVNEECSLSLCDKLSSMPKLDFNL